MSPALALGLLVLLLFGNAFFVAAEFALISARRDQIVPRAAEGSWAARVTLRAVERVSLMMAGSQLGITACSLLIGAVGEPALASLLEMPFEAVGIPAVLVHPVALVIALLIVVYLHMVLGEMVPKNIALAGPTRAALVLGPPMYGLCWLFRPFIALMNLAANGVLQLMRVTPQEERSSSFTREEVADFVAESGREGLLDEDELSLLSGALEFETLTAGDVAMPPDRLRTVHRDTSIADLERLCAETGFSRFPVVDDSGAIAGYVHLKDVLDVPAADREGPVPPEKIHPLGTVSADDGLREVIETMRRHSAHLAKVEGVTGRGENAGIVVVALEDVLEELVGEVRDATTPDHLVVRPHRHDA